MQPVVYAASDLHGNLPSVPKDADVLLLAGDICPDFRPYGNRAGMVDKGGTQQSNWLDTTFREWLESIAPTEVVAIWGNHDFVGEKKYLVPDLPWTLLEDAEATVRGVRVWGTPWVPGLPYWAFYGTEAVLSARADLIPFGLDVLMTHGPPLGHGDFIPTSEKQRNKYGNYGGMNVGDPTLAAAICREIPAVTICGHIHEARGEYNLEGNPVYNVAAVDEVYNLHDDPFVRLDLD
jgi:Icc-related predicted phosphoesterase